MTETFTYTITIKAEADLYLPNIEIESYDFLYRAENDVEIFQIKTTDGPALEAILDQDRNVVSYEEVI